MRRHVLLALVRRTLALGCVVEALSPGNAEADEPLGPTLQADDNVGLSHLLLDTGRVPPATPEPDTYRVFLHGEYQLRYQAEKSFLLEATPSARNAQPGLAEQSLGQNQFVYHWLRITPRAQLLDKVEIIGQADLTGLVVGDKARGVSADATPRDAYDGLSNVQPRWLYAEYRLPGTVVRVGQQPNHWGMGIFANDGDHPTLFGDYRYGQISERVMLASTPGGPNSPLRLAIAGDFVFRDNRAELTRGDHAFQGVLAGWFERGENELGFYSTVRHQERDRESIEQSDTVALDVHGKALLPVLGDDDAFFVAEAEATGVFGTTNADRSAAQALRGNTTDIRAYGGAASFGFVHRSWSFSAGADDPSLAGAAFGDFVGQIELGYASGDSNPYDGTLKRFTFDPNHRIGLLLFDEVLRFQTARAATAAQDPLLTSRAPPGIEQLPSNGGVFGAQYVNPTVIVRPRSWLDLKGGVVIAQATSDVVDPYRTSVSGSFVNYRGGDPRKKDLGVELDAGVEARFPLRYGFVLQIGAQAGLLFPGSALEDANGAGMPTQWIAVGRLGLQF